MRLCVVRLCVSTATFFRLDCDFPSTVTGATVSVKVPLPKSTSSCSYELGALGQTVKYDKDDKVAVWKLSKIKGGLACVKPPIRFPFSVQILRCGARRQQETCSSHFPRRLLRSATAHSVAAPPAPGK